MGTEKEVDRGPMRGIRKLAEQDEPHNMAGIEAHPTSPHCCVGNKKNSGRKVSNLHLGCRKLQRTSASEAVLLSSGGSSGLELRNVNGRLLAGVLDRNASPKEVSFNPGRGEHPQDAAA